MTLLHGGAGRQQGRKASPTALVYVGAKIERETRDAIDAEAKRLGRTRNAIIREWLADSALRALIAWGETV